MFHAVIGSTVLLLYTSITELVKLIQWVVDMRGADYNTLALIYTSKQYCYMCVRFPWFSNDNTAVTMG